MADEASQCSTWRRVVGPFGVHAEGSAPSARSWAASWMFADSGSVGEAAAGRRRVDAEERGGVEPEDARLHARR